MRVRSLCGILTVVGLAGVSACSDGATEPEGKRFKIGVGALDLPNMQDACYGLEVTNDLGETVWSLDHVCSSQYGNSIGDITYIGTCDAQDNDNDGSALNTVTLTVENIYTTDVNPADYAAGAVPDAEWDNPCAKYFDGSIVDGDPNVAGNQNGDAYGPCQLAYNCEENADVQVVFNITMMRDAQQGFFDIAVNFEDIFCSAKVDCEDTNGDPNMLLFGKDGKRQPTLVMAFACSAGEDSNTTLYMDNVTVTCDGDTGIVPDTYIRPFDGPGNIQFGSVDAGGSLMPVASPPAWWILSGYDNAAPWYWWLPLAGPPDANDNGPEDYRSHRPVIQQAVYEGVEQLGDYNKAYWNTAIAFNMEGFDNAGVCTLHTTLGAADGRMQNGATPGQSAANTTYPAITVNVPLNPDGEPVLDCGVHPLNGDDSGVQVAYSPINNPWCFEYEMVSNFTALTTDTHQLPNAPFPGSPENCTKYGTNKVFFFKDNNNNGTFEAGIDAPQNKGVVNGFGPYAITDANGTAVQTSISSVSANQKVQLQVTGVNGPTCSAGFHEVIYPQGGYTFWNPQGGTGETFNFWYQCVVNDQE